MTKQHLVQPMQNASHRVALKVISPTIYPRTVKHYGGAACMHASPKFCATDGFNRLHEIPNALVADARCSTTGSGTNATPAVMAIVAASSADRLAGRLRVM
jgi:hypothetical protein